MFEALYIIYLSDNPVHTTAQLILHTNHFQVHAFLFPFVINAELYWTINWNRLLLWRRYDLFKLRFILVHFSSWRCNVSRNWNISKAKCWLTEWIALFPFLSCFSNKSSICFPLSDENPIWRSGAGSLPRKVTKEWLSLEFSKVQNPNNKFCYKTETRQFRHWTNLELVKSDWVALNN